MFSNIGGVARSVVIYVLLQSVTSHPVSRASARQVQCLSRCLLLGIRHSYYDVSACHTICDHHQNGGVADDESTNAEDDDDDVTKRTASKTTSNVSRIMEILDKIDPASGKSRGCGEENSVNAKWDLKYEKKTEYKQLTLPVVAKRRWGSTIGPCIAAHCAGRTGASRTACIVNMCNRKRDAKLEK